jgi:hypothetical protein
VVQGAGEVNLVEWFRGMVGITAPPPWVLNWVLTVPVGQCRQITREIAILVVDLASRRRILLLSPPRDNGLPDDRRRDRCVIGVTVLARTPYQAHLRHRLPHH